LKWQREKKLVNEIEDGDLDDVDPDFGDQVVDILSLNCDIITHKFFTSSSHTSFMHPAEIVCLVASILSCGVFCIVCTKKKLPPLEMVDLDRPPHAERRSSNHGS
jgi:hypothetical protein